MAIKKISKNVISIEDSNNKEIIYVTQSYCNHKYKKERGRVNRYIRTWYDIKFENEKLRKIISNQHEDIINLKKEKEVKCI
jgi:polyribonucleotide nucleotidyltransferase